MTQSSRDLIGLTGRKGSGKDTMAEALVERGYANLKFAGGLKAMIATLLHYQGADAETIDRMIEGDLKEVPSDLLQGQTPRWAMQSLGTEWGRNCMGENLWVDATMNRADTFEKVVITDVRFPNECAALQKRGGLTIRITPVGEGRNQPDMHPSEMHIDDLPVAGVFSNDKSLGIEVGREQFIDFIGFAGGVAEEGDAA